MPETLPIPLAAILTAAEDAKRAHDRLCDIAETLLPAAPAPARPTLRPLTEDDYRAARDAYTRAESSYVNAAVDAVYARLAASVPHWVPVAPGTAVDAGTRYRNEFPTDGDAYEHVSTGFTVPLSGNSKWFIDPHTVPVPAEPEDPAIAVVEEFGARWGIVTTATADARELLTRIDAARDKK